MFMILNFSNQRMELEEHFCPLADWTGSHGVPSAQASGSLSDLYQSGMTTMALLPAVLSFLSRVAAEHGRQGAACAWLGTAMSCSLASERGMVTDLMGE